MSVFLTPDGAPFYGGTYFPDRPRHGMPSFRQVLEGVSEAWTTQRGEVARGGPAARRRARRAGPDCRRPADGSPSDRSWTLRSGRRRAHGVVRHAQRLMGRRAQVPAADDDRVTCSAGSRPATSATGAIVRFTLDKMADGGIRDQLGGGFHRYATDAALARAALRADALRQRPARAGLPARLGDARRRALRPLSRGRDAACSTT